MDQDYAAKLAQFAVGLTYEDLPVPLRRRIKDCIADTVGAIIYGARLPWSGMIVAHAVENSAGGKSVILASGTAPVHPAAAALAHGAMAHAFELDNLTQPSTGVHPGAIAFSSGLAMAQEKSASGRALIAAMAAGIEIMIRIGRASKGTAESRGFHAPGLTGPFGAAVVAGKLIGLDAEKMTNALGIAGSLCSGLMEFAHGSSGAMVKRLHLGRAAESGVLAASLAARGFTGPRSVMEGEAGFFRTYCSDCDLDALTAGLGHDYAGLSIMIKRYACHLTAQRPVEAVSELTAEHGFSAADVAAIAIYGNRRMAGPNNIQAPADVMMAQYSIPFSVALALYRNPMNPESFDADVHRDPAILDLAKRVSMVAVEGRPREDLTATVTVTLKGGSTLSRDVREFSGTPARPLTRDGLQEKFLLLSGAFPRAAMLALFDRLQTLENEDSLEWLRL